MFVVWRSLESRDMTMLGSERLDVNPKSCSIIFTTCLGPRKPQSRIQKVYIDPARLELEVCLTAEDWTKVSDVTASWDWAGKGVPCNGALRFGWRGQGVTCYGVLGLEDGQSCHA